MELTTLKEKYMGIVEEFFERKALKLDYSEDEVKKYIDRFEKILLFVENYHEKIEWFIKMFVKYKGILNKLNIFKR